MARKIVKIIHSRSEFEPVCELLEMAIARRGAYRDEYLHAIIRDAKILSQGGSIYAVERSVVRYSSYLSKYPKRELDLLEPDEMSLEQLSSVLRFFRRR